MDVMDTRPEFGCTEPVMVQVVMDGHDVVVIGDDDDFDRVEVFKLLLLLLLIRNKTVQGIDKEVITLLI